MFRGLLLIVLLGVAGFLGYKYWEMDQAIKARDAGGDYEAVTTVHELPMEQEEPKRHAVAAEDDAARQKAMQGIANYIAGHGGNVLETRAFETFGACEDAVGKVTAEYQRRGISASQVADASAFLGTAGKVMVINNNGLYTYLACYTRQSIDWAGYVQFTLTEEQLRSMNK